jgi:hypothetical protein
MIIPEEIREGHDSVVPHQVKAVAALSRCGVL